MRESREAEWVCGSLCCSKCGLNRLPVGCMACLQAETLRLVREEEKATLEAQSLPLRNYLMKFVMPTLTEGLVEVCKVKPDDPVDYLVSETDMFGGPFQSTAFTRSVPSPSPVQAEYLFKRNPQID